MTNGVDKDFVSIDLSEDDKEILVMIYMNKHFSNATTILFNYQLSIGRTFKEALFDAVINETANTALRELMETMETPPLNEQDSATNDK